jgi:hypothetical protein
MRVARSAFLMALLICIAGCNDGIPPVGNYASITGRVVDATTGAGIVNATVAVNGATLTQQTDSNGNFRFAPVPTGDWDYSASADGYATVPLVTNAPPLNPGETRTLTISLTHG